MIIKSHMDCKLDKNSRIIYEFWTHCTSKVSTKDSMEEALCELHRLVDQSICKKWLLIESEIEESLYDDGHKVIARCKYREPIYGTVFGVI